MANKQQSEASVIAKIERGNSRKRQAGVILSTGDDAALFQPRAGYDTVLTCDWFLEGTHFLREKHPAEAVGWKCLARAASDIAAMGGEPRCFLLSLALPTEMTGRWLNKFLDGLRKASRALQCELAGGDTTRRKEALISVTVVGEVRHGDGLRRSGANPGDALFVSGVLGEAELGLRQLRRGSGLARATNAALRKHLYPVPRIVLGQWLARNKIASAMMDISDGLSSDLRHLCEASGVGAIVNASSLPLTGLVKPAEARKLALHGGDDYELLFAVSRRNVAHVPPRFDGLRVTRIGEITRAARVMVRTTRGLLEPLLASGWDPFRK